MEKKSEKKKTSKTKWLLLLILTVFSLNLSYQIIKKPAEVLNLFSWNFYKLPSETWDSYKASFIEHSTKIITPDLLAAIAQIESDGNPLATPKWNFKLTDKLSRIYAPASTSVGLFQFTEGTYNQAKNYCVKKGQVYHEGKNKNACLFNFLYTRILPSHSIEMASGYLHTQVQKILKKFRKSSVSVNLKHKVAAITHLCGPRKAESYVRSGFHLGSVRYCGSHNVDNYLRKVEKFKRYFQRSLVSTLKTSQAI